MELKSLKNNKSIIVQSADKGGALVILDKGAYEQEIRRQLNDTAFYHKLDKNPVVEIKTRVHSCLQDLLEREEITRKEYDFMIVNSPITPVFYTLPKIHKAYSVTPPGRPIVAAIGSLTEKVSAFVDYFLQPCVTSLPSHTKDSIDFIKTLQVQPIQDNNLMVTMDIESLYTNVPIEEGLRAAEHFLHQQNSGNSNTPSLVCLLELMETVLTNNYFMFGNYFYLQVSGVSMGSKMSPSFSEKKMELEHRFRQRSYKEEWITHASQKFSDSTQSELLNRTRTKVTDNNMICAIPFP